MALNLTKCTLYLSLILLVSAFCNTEARRLNDDKPRTYIGLVLDNITDDIYKGIEGIKASGGPSPGGKGHNIPNSETLGERKNSGPSSRGKGHDHTNVENLGDMKNFAAAKGGNGHGFVNADILGEIKNSGPAPGGKGH